jgi:glutaredoxin
MPGPMPSVVLYSRPGCHLCDVARETIEGVRVRLGFDFREVSIEGDDALEREYGIRIPVVLVDGHERFEIAVDADELAKLVNS